MSTAHNIPSIMSYLIELAKSSRSKCKAKTKCVNYNGDLESTTIAKDDLRFGSQYDLKNGGTATSWTHINCVTPKVLQNVMNVHEKVEDISGFSQLSTPLQEQVQKRFDNILLAKENVGPDLGSSSTTVGKSKRQGIRKSTRTAAAVEK